MINITNERILVMNRFFRCKHCGNLIGFIENHGVPIVCCGEEMEALVANTTDAAQEKHVPVVTVDGNRVDVVVGSVEHPMTEEHMIKWIYLLTKNGAQRKELSPGDRPAATFELVDDEPIEVYEWCNLHGLWKTTL